MASGYNSSATLQDSLPTVIDSARIVREYEGVMTRLVDKTTLAPNTGLAWDEISLAALTAQAVNESTSLMNPQQMADTLFSITPTMVGIQTVITDKLRRRISSNVAAKIGVLAQNAMQRKKDEDLLVVLDGATTSLGGAGTTLTHGIISSASVRIKSNTTEPAVTSMYFVGHGFQIKDLEDELKGGLGTYPTFGGLPEQVYRQGFHGSISGVEVFEDGNISIDASDDAKGGVFAREAIVLVQGASPHGETERWPGYGGGADVMYLYDEYGIGERSAGNWLFEVYTDALAPSS